MKTLRAVQLNFSECPSAEVVPADEKSKGAQHEIVFVQHKALAMNFSFANVIFPSSESILS
jgi:hypothetical protein